MEALVQNTAVTFFFPFSLSSESIRLETRVSSATSASSLRAPPTPSSHSPGSGFCDGQNQHIFLYCRKIHWNWALCLVLSFEAFPLSKITSLRRLWKQSNLSPRSDRVLRKWQLYDSLPNSKSRVYGPTCSFSKCIATHSDKQTSLLEEREEKKEEHLWRKGGIWVKR